jgi:iron complex transport system ATP-binding protein
LSGFSLRGVGMRYDGAEVLRGVTLELAGPQFVALVGPNGAGKSTLLGIMAGLRQSYTGCCQYAGAEVRSWNGRALARQVSFIPQSLRIEFPFTAEQVVLMGRTPHCDGLFESPEDFAAVEQAMAVTDTLAFRARDFRTLSGGERQRVILASALAQRPQTLLLDEPATFLDLGHQIAIYRLLTELSRQGLLIVAATHDLNLAASFAGRIVALRGGEVVADGVVLDKGTVREVFGVEVELLEGPGGKPWIWYGE